MVVLAGAFVFAAFAFALTRFAFRQDWRWAFAAAVLGFAAVMVEFAPITTHAVKLDMPSRP